ncbi:MAG TPA: AarF/ABC1/UbiB kinase family protein [Chloroflexia bacterium]|nr:AarF/ABC1/UbiB kinase family protein [Chloroflexia bacterium]
MTSSSTELAKSTSSTSLKERRKRIISLFRYLVLDFTLENFQRRILGNNYVQKRSLERNRKRARRFVNTALELGGVLIKLGQYLSSRFDLLPDVWIAELSRLQDAVPPVSFSELRPIIEQDLGGTIQTLFLQINEAPLASASLGQVHEALLPDGSRVAVKVRRPGIDAIISADLEALNRVIDFLKRRTDLGKLADLKGIAREFEITLRAELDYVKEADNAERFKQNLQKLKYVYVPHVYRQYSSNRVVTTEFIEGYKITDFKAIDAAGLDRHRAARILANCYLNQFLIDGFFHADPHPGNLFLREGPQGVEVVFIDFGMVGEFSREMRIELRHLVVSVINRDVEGVLQTFRTLKFLRREEDADKVRVAISYFIDRFLGMNLDQLKKVDKKQIFDDISYIIYSQPLYVPSNFSFLSRATETLIGICTSLSPQLNLLHEAQPFMRRLAAEELGSVETFENIAGVTRFLAELPGADNVVEFFKSPLGKQVRQNAFQLFSLPSNLNNALDKLESGRLQVQFYSAEMKQASEKLQKSNERLLNGVVASGFLVSGVILATAAAPLWASVLCLLGAGLMGLRLLLR